MASSEDANAARRAELRATIAAAKGGDKLAVAQLRTMLGPHAAIEAKAWDQLLTEYAG
jgi:hypothetical protein